MFLFLVLAVITLAGAITAVLHKNTVTAALALAVSFLGVAGLYIQLDAELMGIFQILVYAGAIMVLFLFIIMLLDIKHQGKKEFGVTSVLFAVLLGGLFCLQLGFVLNSFEAGKSPLQPLDLELALQERQQNPTSLPTTDALLEKGKLPDAHLLGESLFSRYLLPLQIIAVLLLVASVGVVTLSKKQAISTEKKSDNSAEVVE